MKSASFMLGVKAAGGAADALKGVGNVGLDVAKKMSPELKPVNAETKNPASMVGQGLGIAAAKGVDKLKAITKPNLETKDPLSMVGQGLGVAAAKGVDKIKGVASKLKSVRKPLTDTIAASGIF